MFEQILLALAQLQQQVVELQANAAAKEQAKYDEGYAAGLAAGGVDKIYSQAEADALVAAAILPLQDQINILAAEIEQLKLNQDAKVIEFKAQLKAAYEAQQVAETEGETGFKGLLD